MLNRVTGNLCVKIQIVRITSAVVVLRTKATTVIATMLLMVNLLKIMVKRSLRLTISFVKANRQLK